MIVKNVWPLIFEENVQGFPRLDAQEQDGLMGSNGVLADTAHRSQGSSDPEPTPVVWLIGSFRKL
jgi:hypothetical protein